MEYANDEIFKIRYNTNLNRLELKGESWIKKFNKIIKKNKLLVSTIIALIVLINVNIVMIFAFMKNLQAI